MIDIAILGLLDDQELHGYELRKRLGELLGSRPGVSFGSLYPALRRLEKAGHVKAVTMSRASVPTTPMSGSLVGELAAFKARRAAAQQGGDGKGRRSRKVYGITDRGRQHLHDLLIDPDGGEGREFAVRVAFCHHLSPTERLELFERRRAELARRRDERRETARAAGQESTYLRSLLERDTQALTADLEWLDRLIAGERPADGAVAPRTDPGGPL